MTYQWHINDISSSWKMKNDIRYFIHRHKNKTPIHFRKLIKFDHVVHSSGKINWVSSVIMNRWVQYRRVNQYIIGDGTKGSDTFHLVVRLIQNIKNLTSAEHFHWTHSYVSSLFFFFFLIKNQRWSVVNVRHEIVLNRKHIIRYFFTFKN